MKLSAVRVVALSDLADDGVVFDGRLDVVTSGESLADAVLRQLQAIGCQLTDGDLLFFPDAEPKHRIVLIKGKEQLHGIRKVR